jgi:hypothetical protein
MVAILHFVPDEDDPESIIAQYRKMMAPGSYLAVSHASHVGHPTRSGHSLSSTGTPPPR